MGPKSINHAQSTQQHLSRCIQAHQYKRNIDDVQNEEQTFVTAVSVGGDDSLEK